MSGNILTGVSRIFDKASMTWSLESTLVEISRNFCAPWITSSAWLRYKIASKFCLLSYVTLESEKSARLVAWYGDIFINSTAMNTYSCQAPKLESRATQCLGWLAWSSSPYQYNFKLMPCRKPCLDPPLLEFHCAWIDINLVDFKSLPREK